MKEAFREESTRYFQEAELLENQPAAAATAAGKVREWRRAVREASIEQRVSHTAELDFSNFTVVQQALRQSSNRGPTFQKTSKRCKNQIKSRFFLQNS